MDCPRRLSQQHIDDTETEATRASEDAATDAAKVAEEIALNEACD